MSLQKIASVCERTEKFVVSVEPGLDRMLASAWISYPLIFVLQAKILWGILRFRDLTFGDTAGYFAFAYSWYDHFGVRIEWSPLYTAFYGTVYLLTTDIYTSTILHRVIIVMAATIGILAVMRQLLPPALALLGAAWWAVLPINFETLYEVHLFALLPVLAAFYVATISDTPWTRGSVLAILIATAGLVRNEQIIAAGIFALICFVREVKKPHYVDKNRSSIWDSRLAGYGFPLTAALLLIAVFYWRSDIKYPALIGPINSKHVYNMCQVFAFGYAQRHPEWTSSPWLECKSLMQVVFGRDLPTFTQMIWSNPAAVLEHFTWNLLLVFNGFQVALFNRMAGTVNPDYVPVIRNAPLALALSAVVLVLIILAAIKLIRDWHLWWPAWLKDRQSAFLVMLAELCVFVPVILTQRPRPSYLFPATAVIMTTIGLAVYILLGNRRLILAKILAAVGVPLLLLVVPSYYLKHKSDRPIYTDVVKLQKFKSFLNKPDYRMVLGDYVWEIQGYLRLRAPKLVGFDYGVLSSWHAPQTLDAFLDTQKINVIFIRPRLLQELKERPEARQMLERPGAVGWTKLAPQDGETDWLLLYREPQS